MRAQFDNEHSYDPLDSGFRQGNQTFKSQHAAAAT